MCAKCGMRNHHAKSVGRRADAADVIRKATLADLLSGWPTKADRPGRLSRRLPRRSVFMRQPPRIPLFQPQTYSISGQGESGLNYKSGYQDPHGGAPMFVQSSALAASDTTATYDKSRQLHAGASGFLNGSTSLDSTKCSGSYRTSR